MLIIILLQDNRSRAQVKRWRHRLIVHINAYMHMHVDICIRPRSSMCMDTIHFRNKPIRSWPDEFQINVNACREKEDFINA